MNAEPVHLPVAVTTDELRDTFHRLATAPGEVLGDSAGYLFRIPRVGVVSAIRLKTAVELRISFRGGDDGREQAVRTLEHLPRLLAFFDALAVALVTAPEVP